VERAPKAATASVGTKLSKAAAVVHAEKPIGEGNYLSLFK
jgi:hypothetical protein